MAPTLRERAETWKADDRDTLIRLINDICDAYDDPSAEDGDSSDLWYASLALLKRRELPLFPRAGLLLHVAAVRWDYFQDADQCRIDLSKAQKLINHYVKFGGEGEDADLSGAQNIIEGINDLRARIDQRFPRTLLERAESWQADDEDGIEKLFSDINETHGTLEDGDGEHAEDLWHACTKLLGRRELARVYRAGLLTFTASMRWRTIHDVEQSRKDLYKSEKIVRSLKRDLSEEDVRESGVQSIGDAIANLHAEIDEGLPHTFLQRAKAWKAGDYDGIAQLCSDMLAHHEESGVGDHGRDFWDVTVELLARQRLPTLARAVMVYFQAIACAGNALEYNDTDFVRECLDKAMKHVEESKSRLKEEDWQDSGVLRLIKYISYAKAQLEKPEAQSE